MELHCLCYEGLIICVYVTAVKTEKQKLLQISDNPYFEALLHLFC